MLDSSIVIIRHRQRGHQAYRLPGDNFKGRPLSPLIPCTMGRGDHDAGIQHQQFSGMKPGPRILRYQGMRSEPPCGVTGWPGDFVVARYHTSSTEITSPSAFRLSMVAYEAYAQASRTGWADPSTLLGMRTRPLYPGCFTWKEVLGVPRGPGSGDWNATAPDGAKLRSCILIRVQGTGSSNGS